MFATNEAQQLRTCIGFVHDRIADIRSIEAGDEDPSFPERQTFDDLTARLWIRRRGERDAGHVSKALMQQRQLTQLQLVQKIMEKGI